MLVPLFMLLICFVQTTHTIINKMYAIKVRIKWTNSMHITPVGGKKITTKKTAWIFIIHANYMNIINHKKTAWIFLKNSMHLESHKFLFITYTYSNFFIEITPVFAFYTKIYMINTIGKTFFSWALVFFFLKKIVI